MNFNLDDPLGDLLSDNSNDNDSFFDSQPGRKKIINKSSTTATRTTGGKGKMEDLFGIKEESETQFKVPPIRTTLMGTAGKKEEKPIATSTPKLKTRTDENIDILSDLGFDPKNPKTTVSTKSNLFDDILNPTDSKRTNTTSLSSKIDEQTLRRDDGMSTRGTISRQSTETTDNSGVLGQVRPKTSTGRRSSTASPAKNNPLDLFSSSKETDYLRFPTPKSRKKASTADWLGLSNESEEEPVKVEFARTPENLTKVEVLKINEEIDTEILTVPDIEPVASMDTPLSHMIETSNKGAENMVRIVDQQVAQLTLANQMKNQESALIEMQRRQHELLSRQESQFNELLQKQLSRQTQLERSIQSQQDRINTHIQLLMSQPPNDSYPIKENNPDSQATPVLLVELQADVKRLELEKLRLEDLVSTINANYEKEIEIIEKSFRKQIEVLEDHLASVETRLKNENDALHVFYIGKLKTINDDKLELQSNLEEFINNLRKTHEEEIRRLKTAHEEDLDGIKDDHRRMIDNIRQSKLLEFAAVQENGSYLETLRTASTNLESVTGDLQSLRAEMERKIDIIHREREMGLDSRERKLEISERKIQLMEKSSEEEKSRLMDLVTTLETQLSRLSKDSSEENWIMRQKLASLEAEKLTFEKEKSLSREQIARDEKRIEDLKENQLREIQRQMEKINEERTQLNVEKAKIETARKLQSNNDIEQSRQEVDASLKVAQDVTRQAELERERFFKLQRQLETQKRSLIDKENTIRFKEEDLEQNVLQVRANERKANEAIQKARLAEQSFNEKATFLQQKMRELSEKESRLSHERLNLSQERIDLQNIRKKLEQNRCSLCRIGERNGEFSEVFRSSTEVNGININDDNRFMMLGPNNDVDQFLDESVSNSLKRMHDPNRNWSELERIAETVRPSSTSDINIDFFKYEPTNDYLKN